MDRVDELVDLLGCSIVEAQSIIEHDTMVDKGVRTQHDLSKDEEKKALKYANVREHKVLNLPKKEKKIDDCKKSIIEQLFEVVKDQPKARIVNPQKTVMFLDENEDIYTISLGKATKKTYNAKLKELEGE